MTLEQRVAFLEATLAQLLKSDRITVAKLLQLSDGRNIQVGKTTGTKIGTETSQKVGFHGQTPVIQTTITPSNSNFTWANTYGTTMTAGTTVGGSFNFGYYEVNMLNALYQMAAGKGLLAETP